MNYRPTPALQKWWNDNYAKMRNDSSFTKATIVWNAATAAASAAAPQVVADERGIKTWVERAQEEGYYEVIRPGQSISHMEAEIAELRAALAAAPVAYDCWACRKPVTIDERSNADGDCPHCGSELDLEDWPIAVAPVQAQEPVIWYDASAGAVDMGLLYESTRSLSIVGSSEGPFGHFTTPLYTHRAPVQPVAVPDGVALVNAMAKVGQINDHGRRVLLNGEEIGFDLPSLCAIVSLAAPVAQATVTDTGLPELRDHLKIAAVYGTTVALSSAAAAALYRAMTTGEAPTAAQGDAKDAERMEFIENGTFDLSCYNDHDDDVYWNVIEHHMAAPIEREIGWGNTARQAIDAAIAAKAAS